MKWIILYHATWYLFLVKCYRKFFVLPILLTFSHRRMASINSYISALFLPRWLNIVCCNLWVNYHRVQLSTIIFEISSANLKGFFSPIPMTSFVLSSIPIKILSPVELEKATSSQISYYHPSVIIYYNIICIFFSIKTENTSAYKKKPCTSIAGTRLLLCIL